MEMVAERPGDGRREITKRSAWWRSTSWPKKAHDQQVVNRQIVLLMRLLGIGRDGINIFGNLMGICDGISEGSYRNIVAHLHTAAKSVFEYCQEKAGNEESEENVKRDL